MIDRETIKRIALEAFSRGQLEALTYSSGPYEIEICYEVVEFADRLAAELMKAAEPVDWEAFIHPRNNRVMFRVGVQSFTLAYEPEDEPDCSAAQQAEWMCSMLRKALERLSRMQPSVPSVPSGPVLHKPSGAIFDEVSAAVEPNDLAALTPQPVAWRVVSKQGFTRCLTESEPVREQYDMGETFVPLYAHPQPTTEPGK